MKQIVLLQVSTVDEDGYFKQTKTDDDSLLVIVFWVGILFFLVGFALGWLLHQRKVKKDRSNRKRSRSKSRHESQA